MILLCKTGEILIRKYKKQICLCIFVYISQAKTGAADGDGVRQVLRWSGVAIYA